MPTPQEETRAELYPAVPCCGIFEIAVRDASGYDNPFDTAVEAAFTAPSGKRHTAIGFYDGENTWRIRFAPEEAGLWRFAAQIEGKPARAGAFTCEAGCEKGFIRPDPNRPYSFAYGDGSGFYGIGDTCYGLMSGISDAQRMLYLDTRAAQKFNFIRFFASGYPHALHASLSGNEHWPFGGSLESPDYDRLNPAFFRRLEQVLAEVRSRGMYAEILVFNLYLLENHHGHHSDWFATPQRRARWLRNLVARLHADSTVFLWTIANEYALYPDGKYRYDQPEDDLWVKDMGRLIHQYDAHEHPVTVHPVFLEQMGPVFGDCPHIDVLSHQNNGEASATWRETPWPGFHDGPGTEVGLAVLEDRRYKKPVINTENGYEWHREFPSNNSHQTHSTDKCRRVAWQIFASGGAAYAAGFIGTAHGVDQDLRYNRKEQKMDGPLPFFVADMGLAGQLGILADFLRTVDFTHLDPVPLVNAPNLCLAQAGVEYVVYAPQGGTVRMQLPPGSFCATLWNPRSGGVTRLEPVSGEGVVFELEAGPDAVLHLHHAEKPRA